MVYLVTAQDFIGGDIPFQKTSLDDALNFVNHSSLLGLDLETTGLHPVENKMLLLAFGNLQDQFVIDLQTIPIEPFKEWLEDRSKIKVLHNGMFDYKFLYHKGISSEGFRDTMLRYEVRYGGLQYKSNLAEVLKRLANIDMVKEERNTFINHSGPFSVSQIMYAAKDVEHLIPLYYKLEEMLKADNQFEVARLEEEATLAFAEIEYNGMMWDRKAWMELYRENKSIVDALHVEMDELVFSDPVFASLRGDHEKSMVLDSVQGDLFTPVSEMRKVKVNWGSWQQKLKIFHCVDPTIPSTSKEDIGPFAYKHDLLKAAVKLADYSKAVTSYGAKFEESVDKDGKVRTNIKQILQTGRISMSKPNMQQIPAKELFGNKFRNCFVAPEGWVYVSSDFSSQELCIIATGSEDPVWLGALERGEDLHSTAAAVVYGEEWVDAADEGCAFVSSQKKCNCAKHKTLRTNCKTINFGLAYGMGPGSLATELGISEKEAKELMERYFIAFPKIKSYLDMLGKRGTSTGYATTFPPFNRKRRYRGWKPGMSFKNGSDRRILGPIERQSKNHPFQGTGGDQTKTALVYVRKRIKELNAPVKIVMQVHDQVDTICRKDYANTWKVEMTKCMEEAALLSIPSGLLKSETNISQCWEK